MSKNVLELNESNFDDTIASGTVLVDFWAPWCGPCRMLAPILEELLLAVDKSITIGKVNIDDNIKLAEKFRIQSIPSIYLFKNGKIVKTFLGVQSKETLLQAILETA